MVSEGETAPDFTLEGYADGSIQTITLSDVLADERAAILAFYIYDYSPVCEDQLCEINDMEFVTLNDEAAVLGISTDGPYSHREFATDNDISYPLLTDDDRTVYEQYGMTETADDGTTDPRRGIVVVDSDRTLQYRWVADDNWDEWKVEPLQRANSVVKDLPAD
ncbi:MAG: redoxin domain-containing protein [Haloarculaceae archaeon]